jgi:hypothetical protein
MSPAAAPRLEPVPAAYGVSCVRVQPAAGSCSEPEKLFFKDGNDKTTLTLKRAETSSSGVTILVCEPTNPA